MKQGLRIGAAVMLALSVTNVPAADGVLFNGGVGAAGIRPGNNGTVTRIGLIWDWPWRWWGGGDWNVSGQWELTAGTLAEDDGEDVKITEVVEVGITAMLRVARCRATSGGPYVEIGVGPHYLSDTRLDGVDVSTRLQFSPTAGFGRRFGDRAQYELGYRLMHLSNAGIKEPNPGLNYHMLHFAYRY